MERISCVCPTMAGREKYLARAIDSFLSQTYPNRELVLVLDDDVRLTQQCEDRLSILIDRELGLRLVTCRPDRKYLLGEKRNMGTLQASGELICNWDDDDFSFPDRLKVQEELLRISGQLVTAFSRIPFHVEDSNEWWLCPPVKTGVETSLFFRLYFWSSHRFDFSPGCDVNFARQAEAEQTLFVTEDAHVMFATQHSGNISGRVISEVLGWQRLGKGLW